MELKKRVYDSQFAIVLVNSNFQKDLLSLQEFRSSRSFAVFWGGDGRGCPHPPINALRLIAEILICTWISQYVGRHFSANPVMNINKHHAYSWGRSMKGTKTEESISHLRLLLRLHSLSIRPTFPHSATQTTDREGGREWSPPSQPPPFQPFHQLVVVVQLGGKVKHRIGTCLEK